MTMHSICGKAKYQANALIEPFSESFDSSCGCVIGKPPALRGHPFGLGQGSHSQINQMAMPQSHGRARPCRRVASAPENLPSPASSWRVVPDTARDYMQR